jgi:hypothetical protein
MLQQVVAAQEAVQKIDDLTTSDHVHSRVLNSVPSHDIYSNNTITIDQQN